MLASEVQTGDTITYCGETFKVVSIQPGPSGLLGFGVAGAPTQWVASEREVRLHHRLDPKPYKVLTRDYDAEGNKDVRRFSFATPKAQRAFLSRTERCVTFFTT